MYISHIENIDMQILKGDALKGVSKQTAVGPEHGWKGQVMRVFTVSPGGHTPKHRHPWPHTNYILGGSGTLFHEGRKHPIQAGSIAFIPSGEEHQFQNSGTSDLVFICIVPEEGDK